VITYLQRNGYAEMVSDSLVRIPGDRDELLDLASAD
jgi:hypothetical protein